MGFNLIECNPEQMYLLLPSMREWLPAEDLAWFVVDVCAQMNLEKFYRGMAMTAAVGRRSRRR